jgi:hypothetical protein
LWPRPSRAPEETLDGDCPPLNLDEIIATIRARLEALNTDVAFGSDLICDQSGGWITWERVGCPRTLPFTRGSVELIWCAGPGLKPPTECIHFDLTPGLLAHVRPYLATIGVQI